VHNLSLEAQNQNHDEQLQQQFARLAETLQKRSGTTGAETALI
jgi:hypothetical protein